jgi:hypothetical protein
MHDVWLNVILLLVVSLGVMFLTECHSALCLWLGVILQSVVQHIVIAPLNQIKLKFPQTNSPRILINISQSELRGSNGFIMPIK